MRRCIDEPSVGVVLDIPLSRDVARPHLSIALAQKIVAQLGVGGFAYVRTPYLDTFYYAARSTGCQIGAVQTFRNGVPMHRMTRIA